MTQTTTDERPYLLGTDDAELNRLGVQHRLWGESAHRLWERARIRPGSRVLDAGCGPGYATFDLAQLVGPGGRVLGVDESSRFVSHVIARSQVLGYGQVSAAVGDVQRLDPQTVEPGGFDAAWARWVLCFLAEPREAVAGMARSVRVGGRVALQDYFGYDAISPAPRLASFAPVRRALVESWEKSAGDLDVMGRVPGWLEGCGLRLVHLGVLQRVAQPNEALWSWPTTFWESYLPRLVEAGLLAEEDRRAFLEDWRALGARGDEVFFHLPPVYEIIAERV